MSTPATKHLYDPALGADFAEDLCDEHADGALRDEPYPRHEVTPADPGKACEVCGEEGAERAKAEAKAFLAGLPFGDEVPT